MFGGLIPSPSEVFDKLEPARMHALMVHLPIAVAMLGFVLVVGVAITGSRSAGLRWTTVFILLLGTLAALWTAQTGEDAKMVAGVAADSPAAKVLKNHEDLAKPFWISLAVTGALVMFSALRVTWFRVLCIVLSILTSAASVLWVGAIGHWGGELVYSHQVGTGVSPKVAPPVVPPVVPPVTPEAPKDDTKKDGKDKIDETKDKKKVPGERELPDPLKKDKTIFDP